MKTFLEYIKENQEKTENKVELFNKLITICLEKYPKEVDDFLNLVSSKDKELRDIIEKIKDANQQFRQPEEVSTNYADNNFGNEEN
jgi:uncharacterized protein YeeX (DUF496 family)